MRSKATLLACSSSHPVKLLYQVADPKGKDAEWVRPTEVPPFESLRDDMPVGMGQFLTWAGGTG